MALWAAGCGCGSSICAQDALTRRFGVSLASYLSLGFKKESVCVCIRHALALAVAVESGSVVVAVVVLALAVLQCIVLEHTACYITHLPLLEGGGF